MKQVRIYWECQYQIILNASILSRYSEFAHILKGIQMHIHIAVKAVKRWQKPLSIKHQYWYWSMLVRNTDCTWLSNATPSYDSHMTGHIPSCNHKISYVESCQGQQVYLFLLALGGQKQTLSIPTRLRIGHTKATKSHILSRGPPTGCHHCGQTLTIDHMLLECALLQECRDEYYTVDSLNALFETIPETCIVEFLREAGFFYLI